MEEHNDEAAGDTKIKDKKHRSCLQKQEGKADKVAGGQAPPPREDEEVREEVAGQMIGIAKTGNVESDRERMGSSVTVGMPRTEFLLTRGGRVVGRS